MMPGQDQMPWSGNGTPTTGARKFCSRSLTMRSPPAATDPIASRIIGIVMVGPDSCGCGICGSVKAGCAPAPPSTPSCSQRFGPYQVISMTRVM